MCACITWIKIVTTMSCVTCSISEQRARVRRVDVGPTQVSWSLRFEPAALMSAMILLDEPLHTLHAILWNLAHVAPNRKHFWLARIKAMRYALLTLPQTLFVRGLLLAGGVLLEQPASSSNNGSQICHHHPSEISIRNPRVPYAGIVHDWNWTFTTPQRTFRKMCSKVGRQAQGDF